MPRVATPVRNTIDLTREDEKWSSNDNKSNKSRHKNATIEVIDLTKPTMMQDVEELDIRDQLAMNPSLCDIRQVKRKDLLLLELWKASKGCSDSFLGSDVPRRPDAKRAIELGKIHYFFGVNMQLNFCPQQQGLIDFTVYDKASSGTGTGKRCVDFILAQQQSQNKYNW